MGSVDRVSMMMGLRYRLHALCVWLSRYLDMAAAYRIGIWFADMVYVLLPARRKVVKEILRTVMGASGVALDNCAREVYRNFSRNYVDVLYRFGPRRSEYPQVIMEGTEELECALGAGRGAILVTAHMGNWEIGAGVIATRWPLWVVAAKQPDSRMHAYVSATRASQNIQVIPTGHAARRCLSVLASGGIVGIVGDLCYTSDTIELDFFGRRALMPRGPGFLSARSGAPVVGVFMVPEGDGSVFRLKFYPPLWPQKYTEHEFCQKISDLLQAMIEARPTHWFCFYDIWKGSV